MIARDYDASIVRWLDCVARGSHRFNQGGTCMDCGAPKRGPDVLIRGGGVPRRGRAK